MPIDPNAIGAKTEPQPFEWTDRDTLLYALGVGAGTEDLAFTTENSHDIEQQVLPTYAVIACPAFAAAAPRSARSTSRCCCTDLSRSGCTSRCRRRASSSVVAEVADIQDKGEGKNAIVMLKATGTDPDTGQGRRRDDDHRGHPRRGRLRRAAGASGPSPRRSPTANPTRRSRCPPARIRR